MHKTAWRTSTKQENTQTYTQNGEMLDGRDLVNSRYIDKGAGDENQKRMIAPQGKYNTGSKHEPVRAALQLVNSTPICTKTSSPSWKRKAFAAHSDLRIHEQLSILESWIVLSIFHGRCAPAGDASKRPPVTRDDILIQPLLHAWPLCSNFEFWVDMAEFGFIPMHGYACMHTQLRATALQGNTSSAKNLDKARVRCVCISCMEFMPHACVFMHSCFYAEREGRPNSSVSVNALACHALWHFYDSVSIRSCLQGVISQPIEPACNGTWQRSNHSWTQTGTEIWDFTTCAALYQ